MVIGNRLKELRGQKQMSQGDLETRTGLLRCYISRVENGHTVPSVDTLEKMARALDVPMYRLFYDGEHPPTPLKLPVKDHEEWGRSGKDAAKLEVFRKHLSRMNPTDRGTFLALACKLASQTI